MGRTAKVAERETILLRISMAQGEQLRHFCKLYERNRTDLIGEIIQVWLNEQYRLYGDKVRMR